MIIYTNIKLLEQDKKLKNNKIKNKIIYYLIILLNKEFNQ